VDTSKTTVSRLGNSWRAEDSFVRASSPQPRDGSSSSAGSGWNYVTNCAQSTVELLQPMIDRAREITWETFRTYVRVEEVRRVFPSYSYRREHYNPKTGELTAPMHIKDDFAVTFHKSHFDGRPCVFIRHSWIEYIFQET